MPNLLVATVIRSLHNIFTSIWVGGMLAMVLSFLPVIRKEVQDAGTQGNVIDQVLIRQSRWVYLGIIVLFGSGVLMTRLSGQSSGLFDFSNSYATILSIKHLLVIVMTLIAIVRSTVFRKAATSKNKAKKKVSMALLMINTLIGVAILVLSSINAIL
ncbi:MAG: CopD family protein [Anaerolineaceae bacterium]|nr:CopD family protein [Anaerolineaceae bacterium]